VAVDLERLPERTRNFLKHGAPKGERKREAFNAACQLRDAGATEPEAVALVEQGAKQCGLPLPEARAAVKSAFTRSPRKPIHKANDDKPTKRTIAATYDYTDESGRVLFQCVRYTPKDFRQRQPDGNGGWTWNLKDVRLVIYRLPEVLRASDVWIVEGEKDCDTLAALRWCATCNPMGAEKWRDEYNDALRGKSVVIAPDNDAPGRRHAEQVARSLHGVAESVRVLRLPDTVKDVSDFVATFNDKHEATERLAMLAEGAALWTPAQSEVMPITNQRPVIQFFKPSELRDYKPPEGVVLVGDCHITRGSAFVIGGAPGVGKSRAAVALAVAGATGADWFGLKVHTHFRTMIVQNENGRFRLSREFADFNCAALDAYVRVCEPPPCGLAFDRAEFCAAVSVSLANFQPDVIVVDPWNAVARDERARDYLETFNAIRAVIPTGDTAPALGIVAHTRKPKADERANGRGLLNLLAGSYVLGSVPRTVFVLQAASDDPVDDRVVWTCAKNNDGELGQRTAWQRRNGLFAPVEDFDWTEFDRPASDRPTVTEADVAEVFQHGQRSVRKAEAVAELQQRTGAGKSACYNALRPNGRFAKHLTESSGLLTWKP
jgi:5S rRNA maturation endonuclease (ribonuclease M5)